MRIVKIKKITKLPNKTTCYDITVKNNANFFANKILVHNCTSVYHDHTHARSLDSVYHPSRAWLKNFVSRFQWEIPANMRICGENVYAFHSIFYADLTSYFQVFSIWIDNTCLNWDETLEYCALWNLETVPVIYRGIWNEKLIKDIWEEKKNSYETYSDSSMSEKVVSEGYVVRLADSFEYDNFSNCLAKYVRANHIQTDEYWMFKKMHRNLLNSNV